MLKRLAKEGLLERSPDGAVLLTDVGRRPAHEVLRRHRLVERLLTDVLGVPWYAAHDEAHRLEHSVSRLVEERLFEVLRFPEYCPHGHPICPFDSRKLRSLQEVGAGEEVAVAQISEIKEELLPYFDQVGLRPASIFKVIETTSFGPLTLETEIGTSSVSREVAAYLKVCDPDEADWIDRRSG